LAERMAWRGRACVPARAIRYPIGSKPNRLFRRLTCLRLVGTGLIVGAPPLEHPRAALRMRSGTPSAPLSSVASPLSIGSFNPLRGGRTMVLGPSLGGQHESGYTPPTRTLEKSPRLLHLQLRQSNLRKRSNGEKDLLGAAGWAGVAYPQPNDSAILVVSP
jgi:hypothetical protein